jgi:membrane protein required for colicin V production
MFTQRRYDEPMNIFDIAVIGATLVAVVMGYRSGLLRSLATIFGYLLAAPLAVVAAPKLAPLFTTQSLSPEGSGILMIAGVFLVAGGVTAALLRGAVSLVAGEDVSVADRAAGAALGAVRILLLAILMVLIFERIIPPNRAPAWLSQSQLRPLLAAAGERGVRQLPPDVVAQIDRMKR